MHVWKNNMAVVVIVYRQQKHQIEIWHYLTFVGLSQEPIVRFRWNFYTPLMSIFEEKNDVWGHWDFFLNWSSRLFLKLLILGPFFGGPGI